MHDLVLLLRLENASPEPLAPSRPNSGLLLQTGS